MQMSYNIPANSSGALFAQLHVDVAEPEVTFESVEVRFISVSTVKKPVNPHCQECAVGTVAEAERIELAKETMKLKRGDVQCRDFLFPGNLPATTRGARLNRTPSWRKPRRLPQREDLRPLCRRTEQPLSAIYQVTDMRSS